MKFEKKERKKEDSTVPTYLKIWREKNNKKK